MAQTVEWISNVIDAHFTSLILSAETHSLLRSINDIMINHNEVCEQMKGIQGIMEVCYAALYDLDRL